MQVYLYNKYYITVTKTDGRHPIPRPCIRSAEVRGKVIIRMGTQQQYNNQDKYLLNLFHLKHGLDCLQSGELPKTFGYKLLLSLSAQLDSV